MPILRKSLFATVLNRVFDRAAASRQGALLWVLAIAVEKQLPLVPVLEAFAEDSKGPWRTHALELAAALRSGTSLPDALIELPGIVPKSAVLAARVGAESGTLGPALRVAAETFTVRQEISPTAPRGMIFYPMILLSIFLSIVSFVMYYIIPKFKKIFEDFGTELPDLTITIIKFSDAFAQYGIFIAPLIFLMLAVAGVAFAGNFGSIDGFFFLSRFAPRIRTPDLLRSLAVVIQAGRPLAAALTSLSSHHPDMAIRRRLFHVERDVEAGSDLWDGLANSGMIRHADAAVLSSAQRAGNLPWALRSVAETVERRLEIKIRVLLELVRPIVLLVFGVLIGLFCVGMFLPMVKIINDLA